MKRGRGKSQATIEFIEACHEILEVEQPTTVRAVAYRLFTRKLIPSMNKNSTNKVSRMLKIAREEGTIPWEWIVDETRAPERVASWKHPEIIINAAVKQYRRDNWQDQPCRVEVWSEKGTVRGTLKPVQDKYGITLQVMHGFTSATNINDVALNTLYDEKPLIAFYVGDYDPSGMCMSEVDLPKRISKYNGTVEIRRIALVKEDTLDPALPYFEASTKKGDTRYKWFVKNYGHKAWELDAMRSDLLRERVEKHIRSVMNLEAWEHSLKIEDAEVESMNDFYDSWQRHSENNL